MTERASFTPEIPGGSPNPPEFPILTDTAGEERVEQPGDAVREDAIEAARRQVEAAAPDASEPELSTEERLSQLCDKIGPPFNDLEILKLTLSLAEQVNSSLADYDLIVGDDRSGRLPAMVFWWLAKFRREEAGLPAPVRKFMQGKYRGDPPDDFFPAPASDDSRALIVTEYVDSGDNVGRIRSAISANSRRDRGSIDVATLTYLDDRSKKSPPGANFYHPTTRGFVLDEFQSLVPRDLPERLIGRQKTTGIETKRLPADQFDSATVAQAVRDTHTVAQELYRLLPAVER